jgi:CBS domain-containing protein
MVMLSRFLQHRLTDAQGHRVTLLDFAVDLSTGDYPTVTHLIVRGPERRQLEFPWAAVQSANWGAAHLQIADVRAGQHLSQEIVGQLVLLKRDVLDALVLDLEHRQAVRANDLWLYDDGDALRLRGVDIGPWALLRRLGQGLLGRGGDRHLLDWKYVEFLRGDPRAARAGRDYHRRVAALPPAAIARLMDDVPYLHAAELLTLIPDPVAADTLEAMTVERQVQVFEELDEDQALRLLSLMAPDQATDLLGRLDPGLAERHLNALPALQRQYVVELLRYPEDTVGGIMTNDAIVIAGQHTVAEARPLLREQLTGPDFVYYVHVGDDDESRALRGVLTLRDFLVADEASRVDAIMNEQLFSVGPLESAQVAARHLVDNHLMAIPVVGRDHRFLGAVTIDAAMAQIAPPAWREQGLRIFS